MDENNSNNNLENDNEQNNTTRTATEVKTHKKNKKKDSNISIEYRKPSVFTSLILMLLGAAIMAIILLTLYIVKDNKDVDVYKEMEPEKEITIVDEQEEPKKSVINYNIDGDFVVTLYKKLVINVRRVPLGYSSEKVVYSTINDNDKLYYILSNMKHETTTYSNVENKLHNKISEEELKNRFIAIIDYDEANKIYKRYYGVDKEAPKYDCESHMGYVYEYNAEDNCFYGHVYAGGGGSGFEFDRKIIKCESSEDQKEVYIYDKFICFDYIRSDKTGNYYSIFGTNDRSDVIKDEIRSNTDGLFDGKTSEKLLNDMLESDGREYKHTFKLDSAGNYYWYSSEKIN